MAISKDNTRVQVTMPKDVKENIEAKATKSNRSLSNYILNLIIEDLKKEE